MKNLQTLKISKINSEDADSYFLKFNNNNFFCRPKHIGEFSLKIDWWIVFRGKEPLCLWPIYLNNQNKVDVPLFAYYFGPIWSEYFSNLKNHSILSKKNEVIDIFINKFKVQYNNLIFQFDYNNIDIRYFIWSNEKNKKQFKIIPKYTSVIKNLNKKTKKEILLNFRTLRKRMVKKFTSNSNFIETDSFSYDEIVDLYNETIKIKNKPINPEANKYISIFHKLSAKNNCKIIGFREKKNNKPAALTVVAYEKNVANLIINLSSKDHKQSGISAFNMLEAIIFAKKNGCKTFDFNGANSEVGAHDKDSYGGVPMLYFQIEL